MSDLGIQKTDALFEQKEGIYHPLLNNILNPIRIIDKLKQLYDLFISKGYLIDG